MKKDRGGRRVMILAPVACTAASLLFAALSSPADASRQGAADHALPDISGTFAAIGGISDNDLWAVGTSVDSGGTDQALTEHWDGSSWTQVALSPPGVSADLDAVAAITPMDVWTVGSYSDSTGVQHALIERWDGRTWTEAKVPDPGASSSLAALGVAGEADVWAVGTYADSLGNDHGLVLHWNGKKWQTAAQGVFPESSELTAISAASTNDVWAVGNYFTEKGEGASHPLVEHWNGSSWHPDVVFSRSLKQPHAVAAFDSGDVWLAGADTGKQSGQFHGFLAHGHDGQWSQRAFKGVFRFDGMAGTSTSDVWAVGFAPGVKFGGPERVLHWDGGSWTQFKLSQEDWLHGVTALSPTDAFAAGCSLDGFACGHPVVEHWDGSTWLPFGS
jgi:hypothetical protein